MRAPYPVGVLVVAAVLSEGGLAPLGQQDLGADVPVHCRLTHHGAGGHFIAGRGAARHDEGLGALATGEPVWRGRQQRAAGKQWWGRGARGHAAGSAPPPLAPGVPGDVPALHVPSLAHGVSQRCLMLPKNQVSAGRSANAHSFGTSCDREKAEAELGTLRFLKGRMQLAPSPLASPGPLVGTTAPASPPIPQPPCTAHRPISAAPPPSVLPCSAVLPLPAPGPAATPRSSATLRCRARLGVRSGAHGAAVPVCPLRPGAPGRAKHRCDINGPKYIPGEEVPGNSLKF